MRESVFIYSAEFEKYHYPPQHPFDISRAGEVRKIVESMGLLCGAGRSEVVAKPAERIVLKKLKSLSCKMIKSVRQPVIFMRTITIL